MQSLSSHGEFAVAGHGDVDEVLAWARTGRRSVVLASRTLPGVGRLLSALRSGDEPEVPVALLGEAGAARPSAVGLPPGACGYLPEDADVGALSHAVHTLAAGAAVLPASWVRQAGAAAVRAEARETGAAPPPLSLREREILVLLGQGLTNQQIGKRLSLSAGTVKSYISTVYAKCGVDNRVQAALFAHGIEVLAA
ncbi:response regulator transcription factor [Streptomyces sp. NBRC 14336]|uniref:helix-turn-helix transcriptional regulator n=1 Tax=Streptomyces sp. NBRC 14336 TaxID=3030992 RepID=UPI002556FAE0|nr:response regulator transcription factor [Streptomyces sp. NBRC 14336]WBO79232.1 response regulator transcription factor [Streptomyces sp. SBE_14.2]